MSGEILALAKSLKVKDKTGRKLNPFYIRPMAIRPILSSFSERSANVHTLYSLKANIGTINV